MYNYQLLTFGILKGMFVFAGAIFISACTNNGARIRSAPSMAGLQQGVFSLSVIGETVLLSKTPDWGTTGCILASASDRLLEQIRTVPEGSQNSIRYERLRYPTFLPLDESAISHDRWTNVRGQRVAPWCSGDEMYWIVSIGKHSGDTHSGDSALN